MPDLTSRHQAPGGASTGAARQEPERFEQSRGNAAAQRDLPGAGAEEPRSWFEQMVAEEGDEAPAGEEERGNPLSALASREPGSVEVPEVDRQPYAHGSFMGAVTDMLRDARWSRILQVLMPDVYLQTFRVLNEGTGSPGGPRRFDRHDQYLPLMFENNPVLAAYGAWRTRELDRADGGRRLQAMAFEWDVYLSEDLVNRYTAGRSRAVVVKRLVQTALVAHGEKDDALEENVAGLRQYDDLHDNRPKTRGGGAMAADWMDLFGRALTLIGAGMSDRAIDAMGAHPREAGRGATAGTFTEKMPIREVVELYREVFDVPRFRVFLEIKTRNVPAGLLPLFVQELNRLGVHVQAVSSFWFDEIDDTYVEQRVAGQAAPSAAPMRVHLFHHVPAALDAYRSGRIAPGDGVMFNAAGMLQGRTDAIVDLLAKEKEAHGGHIGVYTQEHDIHPRALAELIAVVNDRPDVFDLGFAYGGVSGRARPNHDPDAWGYGEQDNSFLGPKQPSIADGSPTGGGTGGAPAELGTPKLGPQHRTR